MKGKWKAVLFNDNADCSYILIGDIEGVELFINTSRDVSEELQEEIHSTLNLATAAPEMLEALRWACEALKNADDSCGYSQGRFGDEDCCGNPCVNCLVGKAIDQAEGRE